MEILAHRGWWVHPTEKNAASAFMRALDSGYGIETDIRDCAGALIVSHDPPNPSTSSGPLMTVDQFLDIYLTYQGRPTLALNIKADGLAAPLKAALVARNITSYFVFDMSVPDALGYLNEGMPIYTRHSEFETGSILDLRACGRWLDAFESSFVSPDSIVATLESGSFAAIVSPELHRRPHLKAWTMWRDLFKELPREMSSHVLLCTDFPDQAQNFFDAI